MSNLVYYSLVSNPPHNEQWIQSVRSLRRYNPDIPIYLFYYDRLDPAVQQEAVRQRVTLRDQGSYAASFAEYGNRRHAFQHYKTLHKFRYGWQLPRAEQVLYLDCDTFFFGDVENLFAKYRHGHFFAREEVMTRTSHYGYNRDWVDEEMLDRIAAEQGVQRVTPCNTGVCVMNYNIWVNLTDLYETFLDFTWRLLVGGHDPLIAPHVTEADRITALSYPSSSLWISEEIAFWLTLGKIEGLLHGSLARSDVIQGGEMDDSWSDQMLLAHYWSNGESKFFSEKTSRILLAA